MNSFLLLIPFLLIRFVLLSIINKGAIKRASHFPPMFGSEIFACWIYQVSNIVIFVFLFFLTVIIDFSWLFYIGLIIYILGLILCAISIINFASPSNEGFSYNGLYRFSRNPMYVSYLIYFVGCALLTQSLVLCGIILIFQIASHWIILSEEEWCIEKFGKEYKQYMKKVSRYI